MCIQEFHGNLADAAMLQRDTGRVKVFGSFIGDDDATEGTNENARGILIVVKESIHTLFASHVFHVVEEGR